MGREPRQPKNLPVSKRLEEGGRELQRAMGKARLRWWQVRVASRCAASRWRSTAHRVARGAAHKEGTRRVVLYLSLPLL